jgi:hypothetical protein
MKKDKLLSFFYLIIASVALFVAFWLSIINLKPSTLHHKANLSGLVPIKNPIDFGDIDQGTVEGKFELVNQTSDIIKIVQIDKSCRCTNVEVSKFEIPSSESSIIKFQWDTSDCRGVRGSYFTVLYTVKNHEAIYQVRLDIRGNILPFFEIIPNALVFNKDKSEKKNIRLESRKKDVIIQNVATNSPALEVEKISPHEICVTFYPERFEEDIYQRPNFIITTNCPTEPSYTVFPEIRVNAEKP